MAGRLYVIGSTGTVGSGIARAANAAGWSVLAMGRNVGRLSALKSHIPGIQTLAGSVAEEESAVHLANEASSALPNPDAVIVAVNLPVRPERLTDMSSDRLIEVFSGNVVSHHNAIRAFLPLLRSDGLFLGIGGGMADLIFDGMGAVSMGQGALRNAYKFYSRENGADGPAIRELMIYSMVVAQEDDATADPRQIRADEIGRHVMAMLDSPQAFGGPIHSLKSRKQVGQPPAME